MAFIMLKLLLRVQLLIDTVAMDREDIWKSLLMRIMYQQRSAMTWSSTMVKTLRIMLEYRCYPVWLYDEDGNVLTGELEPYTLAFPVPEVKGYLGNLKITKLGSDGKAVPGVRFMVTGEYGGELSGESGADGKLGFSLPSGYSYEISEDSAPEDI